MQGAARPWHHRPAHVFEPNTTYIVTASTQRRRHYFRVQERLRLLNDTLFEVAAAYDWVLEAWAIFPNQYHFIARSRGSAETLRRFIQRLHSRTARDVNRLHGVRGRRVWFQYWDTCLTYERSYYARLNYVHNNPVKHGLVTVTEQYPFCSGGWFRAQADRRFRRKVESFRYDLVHIPDDFLQTPWSAGAQLPP